MAKAKATSLLINPMVKTYLHNEYKSLYEGNFDRKDLASINKVAEIPNKKDLANIKEDIGILDIKHITPDSKHTTSTQSSL